MARKSVEVNKELLTKCVVDAEAAQTFSTQQELWQKVAELYNATKPPVEITFSVACLRVKAWEILFATESSKGRRKGVKLSDEQKAAMKAGRKGGKRTKFTSTAAQKSLALLREKTPEKFWPLVDKIAKGSRAAAGKLFCIQCMGYNSSEVKRCTGLDCAYFLFRPYQSGSEDEGEATEADAETSPENELAEVA